MAQTKNAALLNRQQAPENVPDASYREDSVDFGRSFRLDEKTTESTLSTEETTESPIMDRTSESSQEILLLKQRLQLKEAMLANQACRIQDLDKEIASLKSLCKENKESSLVKEDLTEASRNNYLEREVATLNGLCKEYKEATSINEDILAIQANQIQKLDREVFTLQDLIGGQREAAEVKDKVLKSQAGQIQDLKDQCAEYKEVIQGLEAQLSEETAAQGLGCIDFDYFVEIN
jgi:chromosome segregation ATPase